MDEYVSGYCPITDEYMEILVHYMEIPILGRDPGIKKHHFKCSYGEETNCPHSQREDCPIFLSCPIVK